MKDAYFGETHVHTSYSLTRTSAARASRRRSLRLRQGPGSHGQPARSTTSAGRSTGSRSRTTRNSSARCIRRSARREGRRQPDAGRVAQSTVGRRAARVVREVRGQQQPWRQSHPPPFYAGPRPRAVLQDVILKAARTTTSRGASRRSRVTSGPPRHRPENMHRNVLFRDLNVPDMPFSALDSNDEEKLWRGWRSRRRRARSCLAIRTTRTAARASCSSPSTMPGSRSRLNTHACAATSSV